MANSQINIFSKHRFTTRNFAVVTELLGLSHELPLKNGQIKIELPSADKLPKEMTGKPIVKSHDSIVAIKSHRKKNGRKIPISLWIKSVDVQVSLNETINLPQEVLTRPPNQLDLISEQQRPQLVQILESHKELANEAFDRWIRILRWKSNSSSIARPEIHGFDSGQGNYLFDGSTKQRFWINDPTLTIYLASPITLSIWHDVEETFKLGQESPIYIDSMFDGIEQFKIGNLQQTVVYLAVACEAFMRTRLMQNLPKGLTPAVEKYIKEARITKILDHLLKDTLDDEQKKAFRKIKSSLRQLFEARNTILHSGHKKDLTSDGCQQYIVDTKTLITI